MIYQFNNYQQRGPTTTWLNRRFRVPSQKCAIPSSQKCAIPASQKCAIPASHVNIGSGVALQILDCRGQFYSLHV